MTRQCAALLAALLLTLPARAELNILFIGNSFTLGGTASVPVIFDRLAQAGGKGDPNTVMRAIGGQDFKFFAGDSTTAATIMSQPWDYVILQNYSTEPTHFVDGSHSLANHTTYGTALYDKILANNPQTRVILFETWSRAVGHSYITGTNTPTTFASTAVMQSELRTNYTALANSLNSAHPGNRPVVVAPVGDAWENAGGLRAPADPLFTDLHGADLYHGDDDGYYLNAAVIYSTIYGTSPAGLSTATPVSSLNLVRSVSPSYLENVAFTTVQESVPEPSSAILLLVTAGGLLGIQRRRNKA